MLSDIKYLPGVGPKRAQVLEKELEVRTFLDLAYTFPARYVDRSRFYAINQLTPDMPTVQVKGRFVKFTEEGEGPRKRLIGAFTDGRSLMEVVWFSGFAYIRQSCMPGREYVLFGKPNFFNRAWSMVHPEIETYDPGRPPEGLRGIYTITDGMRRKLITSKVMHKIMATLLAHPNFSRIQETLPAALRERLHLMPLRDALVQMHAPTDAATLQRARERMKFEELFYLELNILKYSRERTLRHSGYMLPRVGTFFNTFYSALLPFPLTGAQMRVLKEIRADMVTGRQMNRLLQGDVGSGKTVVAFMTLLLAIDNGLQGALMAPTEILATQHYEGLLPWCESLGLQCRLLKGSTPQKERREILEGLENGTVHLVIGTHALIEEKVKFHKLGVAVIDEQHRFGVAQRARLWTKGDTPPHVLVMTATPIPRTLAMTVYGDLEVSVIDELPPGRKPIVTLLRYSDSRLDADQLVHTQLRQGRQVYIVHPLINEQKSSGKEPRNPLYSLEQGYLDAQERFRDYRVAKVHGQMKPDEKAHQMDLFVSGEARILVATTVIEVGVNVPNATVMVIENAERFGLSQLHQLRGRVGRGGDQSYCILMTHAKMGPDTRKRMSVMTSTTDGFVLAEADLKLRGPGDLEGTMQSGLPIQLKVANLAKDGQIISLARDEAIRVLDGGEMETDPLYAAELDKRFGNKPLWRDIS